jgi:magnesium chelatase family protein
MFLYIILHQSNQIKAEDIQSFGFIGELSLNAELRACTGILPMAIEAKSKGVSNLIVPRDNMQEASLVKGINIFGFEKLTDLISFFEGVSP